MKKLALLTRCFILVWFLFPDSSSAQNGLWTWVHGDSTYYTSPRFGIRGVADSSNVPPTLYAPVFWTGKDGRFWIYGGKDYSSGYYSDMWMFDPDTRMWTWVMGDSGRVDLPAVRGIKGVASPSNSPGCRGLGSPAWTDTSGNLWFYGGYSKQWTGSFPFRYMSDLWKFDVQTNEWTWMDGDSLPEYAVKGVRLIPDSLNTPGSFAECSDYWVDANNNFWFFGGGQDFYANDYLWRYTPTTGNWTWMAGGNTFGHGHYGTRGVFDTLNSPPRRFAHTSWQDADNKFWVFGGSYDGLVYDKFLNDLWCYDPQINSWCWFAGDDSLSDINHYGPECEPADSLTPANGIEGRAAWIDSVGNLWKYGGKYEVPGNAYTRNLCLMWCFVMQTKQWMLVDSPTPDPGYSIDMQRHFGTLGIPDINSHPGARCGTASFKDRNGVFYMFGGLTKVPVTGMDVTVNDMWSYTPDPTCLQTASIIESDSRAMQIFPNPASREFHIDQQNEIFYTQIELMNLHGGIVKSLKANPITTIDVSQLASGIYIIHLKNSSTHRFERIVVQ